MTSLIVPQKDKSLLKCRARDLNKAYPIKIEEFDGPASGISPTKLFSL